jgi:predicted RNase H-like nuclease (RuvC/YqgF family)
MARQIPDKICLRNEIERLEGILRYWRTERIVLTSRVEDLEDVLENLEDSIRKEIYTEIVEDVRKEERTKAIENVREIHKSEIEQKEDKIEDLEERLEIAEQEASYYLEQSVISDKQLEDAIEDKVTLIHTLYYITSVLLYDHDSYNGQTFLPNSSSAHDTHELINLAINTIKQSLTRDTATQIFRKEKGWLENWQASINLLKKSPSSKHRSEMLRLSTRIKESV